MHVPHEKAFDLLAQVKAGRTPRVTDIRPGQGGRIKGPLPPASGYAYAGEHKALPAPGIRPTRFGAPLRADRFRNACSLKS